LLLLFSFFKPHKASSSQLELMAHIAHAAVFSSLQLVSLLFACHTALAVEKEQ
jgi:hypothetical protein